MRALLLIGSMTVSGVALAQYAPVAAAQSPTSATTRPAPPAAPPSAPSSDAPPRVSEFRQAINRGTEAYARSDFAGAVTAFQQAVEFEATNAEGYVYLGWARRANGDGAGALQALRTAKTLSQALSESPWFHRSLQAIAQILESDSATTQDARAHWLELSRYLESHPRYGSAEHARARVQAIDVATELEQVYSEVRTRIARRASSSR